MTRGAPEATNRPRVLVVDDHDRSRESMIDILQGAGYDVAGAACVAAAKESLGGRPCDVVVSDLQMPGGDGMQLLEFVAAEHRHASFVMVTAYASIRTAVAAVQAGAFDYLEKPFDADRLEDVVKRAAAATATLSDDSDDLGMAGASPAMQQFRDRLRRAAASDETVLISGESGVGKELAARAVHRLSARRDGPFMAVNCAALSPQLLESELFGHERGAFTGAEQARVGRFEAAIGGTLLLDEISEIDVGLQAKLLRVLQERQLERVGSCESRPIDVRVIATSNRDLNAEAAAGRFREDLFFRLHVLPLCPPPLRERTGDVVLLANRFLRTAAERAGRPAPRMTPDAERLLSEYRWPGNVRELENLMARAVVFAESLVDADVLRPWLQRHDDDASTWCGRSLAEVEQQLIESTLEQYGGHRAKTAAALGIGVRTLTDKLKRYRAQGRSLQVAEAA